MPLYRSRRAYRTKRAPRKMRKSFMRMLPKTLRTRINNYKFTRFGGDSMITAGTSGAGTVFLNGPSGWALTGASTDYNGTYQFGGAMQFQLDQTLQYKDFEQLFDKYRIKGVKVTIIPLGQPSTNATNQYLANTSYPTIAIAVDKDDASLPESWQDVAVKQDCKIKRLNKPVSVYIRNPAIATQIYNGATTAYQVSKGWLNSAYTDVPHYGLKFYIRDCPLPVPPIPTSDGANVMFRIVTKFYLAMKDPQ